jgi:hypothetical protein
MGGVKIDEELISIKYIYHKNDRGEIFSNNSVYSMYH